MKHPYRIIYSSSARLVVTTVALMLVLAVAASACPSCKETVAGANEGLATGLSYSVLGMMSMPFLLVAIVGGIVVRAWRRNAGGPGDDRMPI